MLFPLECRNLTSLTLSPPPHSPQDHHRFPHSTPLFLVSKVGGELRREERRGNVRRKRREREGGRERQTERDTQRETERERGRQREAER